MHVKLSEKSSPEVFIIFLTLNKDTPRGGIGYRRSLCLIRAELPRVKAQVNIAILQTYCYIENAFCCTNDLFLNDT